MKAFIISAIALALFAAAGLDAATAPAKAEGISVHIGDNHRHHRHQVCSWHHHHRVCEWR
jgi:hypothetical protein